MIDWSTFKPKAGCLLLSEPTLADPNFARTVVLLVAHSEEGSVGFVLNRPLELKVKDLGDGFKNSELPVFEGGPVELDTLHYVHRLGPGYVGATEVAHSIYWGGDFELIKKDMGDFKSAEIRFFLGYSGWGPGQLDSELKEHAWLVAPALEEDVFELPAEQLWEKAMRGLGKDAADLTKYPMDPRWN